jgi:chitin disaccharide deacetylase
MYLHQDLNLCRNSFKIPASGKETEKMKTVRNKRCKNVGLDREWVSRVFTSDKVKQSIQKKGIMLISYADLKEN